MGPCGPVAPSHPATEAERPEGLPCDQPRVGTRRRRRHGLRQHPRRRTVRGPVPRGHARGGADLLHRAVRRARDRGRAAGAAGAVGEAVARRGDDDGQDGPRSGDRRQRGRRPAVARRPARRARAGHRGQRLARKEERARPRRRARSPRRASSPRPRSSRAPRTGATAPTGCASCSTSGRRSPGSTGAPTTPSGSGSRLRGRRTPGAARSHFAEQHEKRDGARVVKERLAKEAEALADSTDWGPTAGRYRDLMRDWKAAGPAPKRHRRRAVEAVPGRPGRLLRRPRRRQRRPRRGVRGERRGQGGLLVEAEALVPVTDLEAAKRSFRDIAERWDAAGKVPARPDQGPRGPDPPRRAGDPLGRGGPVAPQRPGEVRPRRRHGRQARGRHRRHRGRPREGSRRRRRQEDRRPRGEPRLAAGLPRHGPKASTSSPARTARAAADGGREGRLRPGPKSRRRNWSTEPSAANGWQREPGSRAESPARPLAAERCRSASRSVTRRSAATTSSESPCDGYCVTR